MKNKIVGVLVAIGLISSCNNAEKSEIKSDNKAKIEFKDRNGNKITKEELARSTGEFNFETFGTDEVTELAKTLHNQARQFGQSGDYENAVERLMQTINEAPNWPYPLYDLAFTYLLQDDYDNALKYYQMTDEIAPKGFYTSKTAIHTLERESKGELQRGLYKSYLSLEWIDDNKEKEEMIKLLVEKFPSFAPGWKEYSNLLEGNERLVAIEKGLEQNPDIDTKGMLLINKALVLNQNGNFDGASVLLADIIFDSNSTYGNIETAKFVLNNITDNK